MADQVFGAGGRVFPPPAILGSHDFFNSGHALIQVSDDLIDPGYHNDLARPEYHGSDAISRRICIDQLSILSQGIRAGHEEIGSLLIFGDLVTVLFGESFFPMVEYFIASLFQCLQ